MGFCIYKKLGLSKDEFREELTKLCNEDTSIPEIADLYNISSAAIHRWMKMFNISRRLNLRSKEWLEHNYLTLKRPASDIATEIGVSYQAVMWYLNKFEIRKRNMCEVQQNRNRKNEKPNKFHYLCDNTKPFSYCFWFDDIYFSSTAEYIFYKMNNKIHNLKSQPFIFENRRPDFLVDNKVVVEIKCEKRNLKQSDRNEYIQWGKRMSEHYGYQYTICYVYDKYTTQYKTALKWLQKNATIGHVFCLLSEI